MVLQEYMRPCEGMRGHGRACKKVKGCETSNKYLRGCQGHVTLCEDTGGCLRVFEHARP